MEEDTDLNYSQYNIYFKRDISLYPDIQNDVELPAIIFLASSSNWNDFHYKCNYSYLIFERVNQDPITGHLCLGFLVPDYSSSRETQQQILDNNNGKYNPDSHPPFFSLQDEINDYRTLVSSHGISKAKEILLAVKDLVILKQWSNRPTWYSQAEQTEVFRVALMRTSERFFAFHNADSVLNGINEEDLSSISQQLSLEYNLDGFSNNHQIDLDFDITSRLPKRINILIGKNGLGKSQTLYQIIKSLQKGDEKFKDRNTGRPMISRVLAIATPGETSTSFPSQNPSNRIKYRRLTLDRNKSSTTSKKFGELCVQLARSMENIGRINRWDIFISSISFLSIFNDLVLPLERETQVMHTGTIRINEKKFIPLSLVNTGGEQAQLEMWDAITKSAYPLRLINDKVYPLSSGQLAFIKFAVQACLFIENGTLVLLDEPETHLHPNYISKFVRLLDRLLSQTGSIAIIATHSAYFVREIPRKQVHVFKRDSESREITIQNPRLKTFGTDVSSISHFIFEDEITNILVEELIEKLPQDTEARRNIISELQDELSSEMIMHLKNVLSLEELN